MKQFRMLRNKETHSYNPYIASLLWAGYHTLDSRNLMNIDHISTTQLEYASYLMFTSSSYVYLKK